ncbi:peptidoglycan/LPS O-acetylase OafA/YrhL [Allocatelliglobosispora scoriae]|uniref:Peptidoglycan/LPS O-acetylase OafA/YrhL n=1 Tax=Allocatelliglobosispora scoriae TaxID=643052 RepID=A0A841BJP6_9ACTN|nr:acyltransferase family protein [Allocatelliglobosispora scoriae]MBB5867121.1 peptidoglycan/LPS O-acetylase OafA/YrhL [Allocatelliglobosispora scoriae]
MATDLHLEPTIRPPEAAEPELEPVAEVEPEPQPEPPPAPQPSVRLDIQGLRAIAVLAVVVYHLWPGLLPGGFIGVDAFFVISGFLITSHLLREPPRTARDLVAFWGRRARRLLPASLLVLGATLAATVAFAPVTHWARAAGQVITSALYVQNWRLSADAVDYLNATDPPTAVQHFWSLSVEEQFYLAWPILILAVALAARVMKRHVTRLIATVVTVVVAASFAASVWVTATSPVSAYFSTPVRIWELGAGGLLAAVLLSDEWRPRLPAVWSLAAGAGLAAIGWSAWGYSAATPFPGWAAALPVAGCVAVLAAGALHPGGPVERLLGRQPLAFLGDISYSVYLWHWPLLILLPHATGRPLGALDRVGILAATIVLAVATKRLVEDPFRRPGTGWLRRGPFRIAAIGMVVVVAAGFAVIRDVDSRRSEALAVVEEAVSVPNPCFGAAALALGAQQCPADPAVRPVPYAAQAQNDLNVAYADDCFDYPPFPKTTTCTYGRPDAKVSIALVGNSHAGHWLPALLALTDRLDFKITTYLASGCNVSTTRMRWEPNSDATACLAWAQRVVAATEHGYDLVVTSAYPSRIPAGFKDRVEGFDAVRDGHRDMIDRWIATGTDVLVIRDTPHPANDFGPIPDCVAAHETDVSRCSGPRTDWVWPDPLSTAATDARNPHVVVVDLTDFFCDPQTCYGVIGGVIAFSDVHHMTQTYGRTLAPYLAPALAAAIDRAVGRQPS